MKVSLKRFHRDSAVTLGVLKIQDHDHRPLYTLENPWKENIPSVSCIPQGEYQCCPFNGNKFKNVYEIENVEGRTYILFHKGNYEHDTKGCILPGLGIDSSLHESMVTHSVSAMNELKRIIGQHTFTLNIMEL